MNENKDAIDLGSVPADFDPFPSDDDLEADAVPNAPIQKPQAAAKPPATPKPAASANPLENAINAAESKEAGKAQQSLMDKPPVFEYAGAAENIEDISKTFEELRIEKATDFPELEDGKRVSWTIEYGKVTKTVANPKGTSIGKLKADIETGKEFLDALKKAKDKNPVCKVKPRVTAQSKGTASYKGTYVNIDEAEASGKLITLFPGKCGNMFEMRNTEMGRFITRAANNDILREVTAGFAPALPPVPLKRLQDILGFFKMMARDGNNEALANIYWDKVDEIYITDIPQQSVSMFSVKGEINPAFDNDRYIHFMDIHSHNTMPAFFSATDDADEKATRVYAVIGNVLSYFPEIRVRISNGGKFHEIEPGVVFEDFNKASKLAMMWFEQFQFKMQTLANMISASRSRNKPGGDGE